MSVAEASLNLSATEDLDPLVDLCQGKRVVLIGEFSHGTSECYTWRARLTRRLIEEAGASCVAVEGDWPACDAVTRYVRGQRDGDGRETLSAFQRWPRWMWDNYEVLAFIEWLRERNASASDIGFYGLDLYSLWESLAEVLVYAEQHGLDVAETARRAQGCFDPFMGDEVSYARATAIVPEDCVQEVGALLAELRRKRLTLPDGEFAFSAEMNAQVIANAEEYYRAMILPGPQSWNVRDTHMMEVLVELLDRHGPGSRAVVWAHNTHVGDARATDMAEGGLINIGQLCREHFGDERVAIIGFLGHEGEVMAGGAWDAPQQVMELPKAPAGSWDRLFHEEVGVDCLSLLDDPAFREERGQRAVGVVYDPRLDASYNYVPTVLGSRYDAVMYLDQSAAVSPLSADPGAGPPELYPWGI